MAHQVELAHAPQGAIEGLQMLQQQALAGCEVGSFRQRQGHDWHRQTAMSFERGAQNACDTRVFECSVLRARSSE